MLECTIFPEGKSIEDPEGKRITRRIPWFQKTMWPPLSASKGPKAVEVHQPSSEFPG